MKQHCYHFPGIFATPPNFLHHSGATFFHRCFSPRAAKGGYFEAPEGSKAADWELPARTGKQSQAALDGMNGQFWE